ncbi:serine hydrolase [Conexibacter woesei]|uniref:serine hydrolase n=1 Tax=Conexibacter woesei TaxID=191495 RepID=UPI000412D4FE|nr:serine hydrolase [Conexibacter woesei]
MLAASAVVLVVVAVRAPSGPASLAQTQTTAAPATVEAVPVKATSTTSTSRSPVLATAAGVASARKFAARRRGVVGFAVLDGQGRMRGVNRSVQFPSASVVKAMLLVATLRRYGHGHLDAKTAQTLTRMIEVSDNDAADAIYRRVGAAGLYRVANAAHARHFRDVGYWASAQLTAADQARFFYNIDKLVPSTHRHFARKLLSSVVSYQRWGIAPVAAHHNMKAFFKGGWRTGITHQVALLIRGNRRVALAVLTSGAPSQAYGEQTIEGIAARVLR